MAGTTGRTSGQRGADRLATETKAAPKTTEFVAFIVVTLGILISAMLIDGGDTAGGGDNATDEFTASQAWLYVAIVTFGYMLSRGLAKSGSRDPYWGGGTNEHQGSADR